MDVFNVPVLVVIFNRPDLARALFNSLEKVKPEKLYVAADGPREDNENDALLCEETRKVFDNIPWECEVKYLYREKNIGCGVGVSSAITWLFENESMGIILEDDCLPHSSFFRYCEELLHYFKDDERIFSINGFNPLGNNKELKESFAYIDYNLSWGWASWSRAWKHFAFELDSDAEMKSVLKNHFKNDFISRRSWFKHLKQATNGKIWDYQWLYSSWKGGGIHIMPAVSLTENNGFRADGTNYSADDRYSKIKHKEMLFPLKFPKEVKINKKINPIIKRERFGNYLPYFIMPFIKKHLKIKN